MKKLIDREVVSLKIREIEKIRSSITFPEYQRQDHLWKVEKKSLLIDSILNDIDIPKLYFNKTGNDSYEVVDGQQRLWAIWDFLDGAQNYRINDQKTSFEELTREERDAIRDYELQITMFDDADDEYLRTLFIRLQLGLFLVTGEKLHASKGEMQKFVFDELSKAKFLTELGVQKRRYAKETLGAQIAINSFTRARTKSFARTRYEDLSDFFVAYATPKGTDRKFFTQRCAEIQERMKELHKLFGEKTVQLKSRSYVLSVYLLFEWLKDSDAFTREIEKKFVEFVLLLWRRVKEEGKAGIDRKNRELFAFENMLSSAPGEKYQIERRHQKLLEYLEYFIERGKIKGDPSGK